MISSSSAWLRLMVIAVLTTCVVACGSDPTLSGNDETSTTDPVDDDGDNGDVDVDVGGNFESIRVLVSTPQLPSGASTSDDGVTINAILADANNNAVAGITVTFSADSGVLQVTQPTTDDSGTASATLTTGGDPTNREILVTARAANVSSSVTVYVTGTRLLLSGPASIGSGDEGTYTIQLLDSDSVGIANEIVTVESEAGLVTPEMVTATTNADGQVSLVLTGRTGGDDTLTVSALGLSTSQTVSVSEFNLDIASPAATAEVPLDTPQTITARVTQNGNPAADGQMVQFASTRGTLSSAEAQTSNGTADVTVQASGAGAAGLATISAVTSGGAAEQIQIEFVAVTPASVDVQATPATVPLTGSSTVRAIIRDASSNLVKNQQVDFQLNGVGSIHPASGQTNSQGVVTTTYSAPGVSDGTEGVTVSASLREGATISDSASITVGGEALRIALGTGNLIEEPTSTTFEKPYVVVVTDAAGNPAPPETVFRLQVISTGFATGTYEIEDVDPDPDIEDEMWSQDVIGVCPSEDLNENGVLEPGEDFNGNGQLEPDNVASVPGVVELNENGQGFFGISYPQSHNNWTLVRLRATATVAGTETTETVEFFLPGLAADFEDTEISPPGVVSPYGRSGGC